VKLLLLLAQARLLLRDFLSHLGFPLAADLVEEFLLVLHEPLIGASLGVFV